MRFKSIISIFIITILYSCGSKKAAINQDSLVEEINSYVTTIDTNKNLKKEVTEGALTDSEGFKDIGTFKYTVYYDETSKELFKIENVETTDKTIIETYNFKKNKLVRIKLVSGNSTKKIYLKKEKVISEENTTSEDQQLLIEKANRFYKAFKKSH